MSKLAQLRNMKQALAFIESQRADAIKGGEDATRVDREAAILALTSVVDYLDGVDAAAASLRRLLAAFHVSDSPLLTQPKQAGGQLGSPIKDSAKGKIAAVVYLKATIDDGDTRAAAKWVAGKLPKKLHKALSPASKSEVTSRAIYSWYEKWGGENGEAGAGRDGYNLILGAGMKNARIEGGQAKGLPAESALVKVLAKLAEAPGIAESI